VWAEEVLWSGGSISYIEIDRGIERREVDYFGLAKR